MMRIPPYFSRNATSCEPKFKMLLSFLILTCNSISLNLEANFPVKFLT